jgi:hypothetical protein
MTESPGWTSPGEPEDGRRPDAGQPVRQPAPGWSAQQPPPGWSGQQPPPGWSAQQPPPSWGGWTPRPEVKPGVVPLRPIGVGEILDGAISTMRAHPRAMLGLSAIVVLISQLIGFAATWALVQDLSAATAALDESATAEDALNALADSLVASVPGLVVDWLAVLFLTGMLTVVVSRAVLGQQAGIGTAWQVFRPRLPGLLLLSLATGTLILLAFVLPVLPAVLVGVAGGPGGLVVLLAVIGGIGALLLGIYVYVILALASPALVLEKQRVRAAMSRSRHLVRGSWWRVFGILLLAAVITGVISSIITTPFQLLAGGTAVFTNPEAAEPTAGRLFVVTIGNIIGYTLVYPFSAAVSVLLYIDQRMRREGLDLELARAAGAAAPSDRPGEPPAL